MFGSAGRPNTREGYRAEAVRLALWAQCRMLRRESLREVGIATREVLAMARIYMSPFAGSDPNEGRAPSGSEMTPMGGTHEEDRLDRDILEQLAEQGDVQDVGGGRWLPAPLRLVPIIEGDLSLLVGCCPIREFPTALRRSVEYVGMFRRTPHTKGAVEGNNARGASAIPHETIDQWLGPPPPPLEAHVQWARDIERSPLMHGAVATDVHMEVYAAHIAKPQGLRWLSPQAVPDGWYLARVHTPWGSSRAMIVDVQRRAVIAQSGPFPAQDVRRLCYALDAAAGNPAVAEWDPHAGILILHSGLPTREHKLLAGLGTLEANENGHYYPRRWTHLPPVAALHIERMLADLGIRIVPPATGPRMRRQEGRT